MIEFQSHVWVENEPQQIISIHVVGEKYAPGEKCRDNEIPVSKRFCTMT